MSLPPGGQPFLPGFQEFTQHPHPAPNSSPSTDEPNFDIFSWFPMYQSCQKFFIDHAQYNHETQALCSFLNIQLPFQWARNPITSFVMPPTSNPDRPSTQFGPYSIPSHPYQRSNSSGNNNSNAGTNSSNGHQSSYISLHTYIQRLIITGFDSEGILHGMFGEDWRKGIGPIHEVERRNYLFTAKSVGWPQVRTLYDISPQQVVPFMKPLATAQLEEIENAERQWSQWLFMRDWELGPRRSTDG